MGSLCACFRNSNPLFLIRNVVRLPHLAPMGTVTSFKLLNDAHQLLFEVLKFVTVTWTLDRN